MTDTGETSPDRRTYSQMADDPFVSDDVREERMIDEVLSLMVAVLIRRGSREQAAILGRVVNTVIEDDHQNRQQDLWLEYEPEDAESFDKHIEDLRSVFWEIRGRKSFGVDWLGTREVLPVVEYGWRDQLEAALGGKRPTNQGRKNRSDGIRFSEDWLAFTNSGELIAYRALKSIQEDLPIDETIGIYPLAGGRVLGRTWEPDILVTYKGRAGVIEIDGPHHNTRRAFDITRDHLLRQTGISQVDRITVEVLNSQSELDSSFVDSLNGSVSRDSDHTIKQFPWPQVLPATPHGQAPRRT